MNITIQLDESSLEAFAVEVGQKLDAIKQPVQAAMAETFLDITKGNLGMTGIDRASEWPALSFAYAQKVNRSFATLLQTGKLHDSIKMDASNPDAATVSVSDSDCEYSTRHQYGSPGERLPARPYFPIDAGGEVLPYTQAEVELAAVERLKELL